MNRNLTNVIRYFMDEWLPPVIRDNKYLMYPLFYIWYKGKHVEKRMEFKRVFHKLTREEYGAFYEMTDSLSHDRPTDLNQQSIEHIISQIPSKDSKIIDIGCGRGYFLKILQERGYTNISGTDLFDELDLGSATYYKTDIEHMPFVDGEFEVVICSHTIEHVLDLDMAITELKRITKDRLIITVPRQKYYHYTFDLHIHFFPEESYLANAIKMKQYTCTNKNGDWTYVGEKL